MFHKTNTFFATAKLQQKPHIHKFFLFLQNILCGSIEKKKIIKIALRAKNNNYKYKQKRASLTKTPPTMGLTLASLRVFSLTGILISKLNVAR
jgi:hypothetical protein